MRNSHHHAKVQILVVLLAVGQYLQAQPAAVLSEQAKTAIPDLAVRMQSENPKVRFGLIDELVVDESDADILRASLRYRLTDRDYSIILQNALRGLAKDVPVQDQLRLLWRVRYINRTYSLTGIDQAIAEFAESSSADVSNAAVRILVDLKSPLATPFLIPELSNPQKYYRAIQGLVNVNGKSAAPHIKELLTASDNKMQYWAVWALFNLGASEYKDDIYRSCVQHQQQSDINPYFLAVLVKWKDARAFTFVMNRLKNADDVVRDKMINCLAEIGATLIEGKVIGFLEHGQVEAPDKGTERNIKADAIRLLGKLKSQKAIPLLRKNVRSNDEFLRDVAAEQLGLMEAKEAIPDLLSMFDTGQYSDYTAASLALAQIGDPSTVERVLVELKKRRPSAHHVDVLETLAKVSAPQTYRMLKTDKLPKLTSLPAENYFSQIGEKAGITVHLSKNIQEDDKNHTVSPGIENTGLSALRRGFANLNHNGYEYALFIDENIVHVVTVDEAYSKWDHWLQQHSLK